MSARRQRNPQHFPACTQARCIFAQAIHTFMHRKVRHQDPSWARGSGGSGPGMAVLVLVGAALAVKVAWPVVAARLAAASGAVVAAGWSAAWHGKEFEHVD